MRINARTRSMLLAMSVVIPLALTACGTTNSSDDDKSSDSNSVAASQNPDQGDGNNSDDNGDGGTNGVNCTIKGVMGDKSTDTIVEQVGVGLTKGPTAQVYSDNRGTHSGQKNLAFCQKVNVLCFAPNQTGMPSYAPGFYRFEIEGAVYYVHSAQFTNGDVLGDASGSTIKDNKVPACK